ncbi:hypothetical protein [Nocardiopsis sp. FIRDI 009]|uniref:hypothetical protein n=1 Tax=Nocardiopsis sp. FIRDI 009 TaxID=714197 RepID=UPI000E25C0AF|nr:hypothetical protein [Nocardiopsis sp. FIRDI 009]
MSWAVLIEENSSYGQSIRWRLGSERVVGDRQEAREEAARSAREHVPPLPWSERDRAVYRLSADEYLVRVTGMTSEFHFRVTVAERL